MKTKIIQLFNNSLKPKLIMLDAKVSTLVPNPKIKKILYTGVGSLFGFMLLIIILGLILSPFKNTDQTSGNILNKTKIITTTPEPQKELSEVQMNILNLEIRIKEMRFPESILNIPVIETDISI